MTKKAIMPATAEGKQAFDAAIESMHKSNPMPNISKDDKIGGKLPNKIAVLLPKAVLYAPKFEGHLPRVFNLQELVDDIAFMTNAEAMIAAHEVEIQRIKDTKMYVGIRSSKTFRIIYEAGLKAASDDSSLTVLCDELGAPYKKTSPNDEKKAEIALLKAEKAAAVAAKKAAILAAKVAAKTAKTAA